MLQDIKMTLNFPSHISEFYFGIESEPNIIINCEILKSSKAGRATFLPIKSVKSIKQEKVTIKEEGYVDLAINLVKFDNKFSNVINFACNFFSTICKNNTHRSKIIIITCYNYFFNI